jgi:membrane protein
MGQVSFKHRERRKRFQQLMRAVGGALERVRASDMQVLAASLAFATVVSIVPLLAVSLSVFKAYGGFDKVLGEIERLILQDLAGAAGVEVRRALRQAVERVHSSALGLGGIVGLLFASTKLFHDMETAVHRVWGIPKVRPFWRSFLFYWLIIFSGPVALAVALGAIGSVDVGLLSSLPRRWIALVIGWIAIFAICKWVPSRPVSSGPAFWSACVGSATFYGAQELYAFATTQILNYNKIYGSLASIPIFLVWVSIVWQICLGTVALCASWQLRLDAEAAAAKGERGR